jgi:hypothetical protein
MTKRSDKIAANAGATLWFVEKPRFVFVLQFGLVVRLH